MGELVLVLRCNALDADISIYRTIWLEVVTVSNGNIGLVLQHTHSSDNKSSTKFRDMEAYRQSWCTRSVGEGLFDSRYGAAISPLIHVFK